MPIERQQIVHSKTLNGTKTTPFEKKKKKIKNKTANISMRGLHTATEIEV